MLALVALNMEVLYQSNRSINIAAPKSKSEGLLEYIKDIASNWRMEEEEEDDDCADWTIKCFSLLPSIVKKPEEKIHSN